MTELEERLREAYREAGQTVQPGKVRALPDLGDLDDRASRPARNIRGRRPTTRLLAPLAAAACVAALAVIASTVIPQATGSHGHHARHHTTGPAKRPVTSALSALPAFTMLSNGSSLTVVATATGHVTGKVAAPSGQSFAEVAGTAGDRVFYAAASLRSQGSCWTLLYRIGLSAAGSPLAPTQLTAQPMTGLPTALAASANGGLLAYSAVGCAGNTPSYIPAGQPVGHVGLFDVASGAVTRQWSYTLSEDYPTDLSLSATGKLLGYSIYRYSTSYNATSFQVARVLLTTAQEGPDYLRSRVLFRQSVAAGGGIVSTALSTGGSLMYAITSAADQTLAAYDTSDGRRVQVLHTWPSATELENLVADPAGGYLLLPITHQKHIGGRGCVFVRVKGARACRLMIPRTTFVSIDLATGGLTTLPFSLSGIPAEHAAW